MKITVAWANVLRENGALKFAAFLLAAATIALGVIVVRLALRPPLIIERSCINQIVEPASTEHTAAEIDAFLRSAIHERFDSDAAGKSTLLSIIESAARLAEQKELGLRRMTQHLIVTGIKATGDTAEIETDRLIAVGPVRSAFAFPLTAKIATVERSGANPYGLELVQIKQAKTEARK